MSHVHLALLPRDGLVAKDGRGWYTSDVGRSRSYPWPAPSTVRGALRAAFGQHLAARRERALSREEWPPLTEGVALRRLLALRRPLGETTFKPTHRLWPVPADAVHLENDAVEPLLPRPLPPGIGTLGPEDDEAIDALWRPLPSRRGKPAPAPLFWTDEALQRWLRLEPLPAAPGVTPTRRVDLHLAIDPRTQAAAPSMLHATELLETLDRGRGGRAEWALGVECALPVEARELDFPGGPVGLGGRRRLATAEPLDVSVFAAPERLPGPSSGLRLVLATPAAFQHGWRPDGFERGADEDGRPAYVGSLPGLSGEVVLRAALVPRPLHLSAWDMARRVPRPTRRLVPAGAVYFFQRRGGGLFRPEDFRALWLASWGTGCEEGLGLVLPGAWNPSPEQGA